MTNTNFINIQGSIVRKSEIACITAPTPTGKEEEKKGRKFTYYQVLIILASGYTITFEHYDIRELNKMSKELLKKISE